MKEKNYTTNRGSYISQRNVIEILGRSITIQGSYAQDISRADREHRNYVENTYLTQREGSRDGMES